MAIGPSCFSCLINYLIHAGGCYPWHSCTKNELLSLLLALAHEHITYVDCNDHLKIFKIPICEPMDVSSFFLTQWLPCTLPEKKKIKHVKPLKIRWAKSRQSSSKIRVGRLQLFTFPRSTQKTYALLLDGDSHSRKTKWPYIPNYPNEISYK